MIASALAVVGVVGAIVWAKPSWRLPRPRDDAQPPDREFSWLRRGRGPLSLLAGLAGWALVGGIVGIVASALLAAWAWRTLTRARSPRDQQREEQQRSEYPLVVELLAAALSSGADVVSALEVVGSAVGGPWCARLHACVHAVRIGQPPAEVWAEVERDPIAGRLGRVLARSQETGVPVAAAMRRLAADLREASDLAAQAYVRTIEVRTAIPLGVCFLPAFVVVGVVPLVAAILGRMDAIAG